MAIDIGTLKSLSEKPPKNWTTQDLKLFGIDVPEPKINPKTGLPDLTERMNVQSKASELSTNLKFLVRGLEFANDPNVSPTDAKVFGADRIKDFSEMIGKTVQKYGGNLTGLSSLLDTSLQNAQARAEGKSITQPKGFQPIRPFDSATSSTPSGTLTPQGLSASPAPLPAQEAPALTREYYLSKGIPESMLPPAPLPSSQLHSAGVPGSVASSVPGSTTGQSFLTGTNMVNPLNPANLPALRGSASGTSSIDPTLRPYLELGLRGAEQLFLQQQPSLYPGQMFVGPSEQTQAALNMQEDIALARPAALEAAQESYMRGLGGLAATAGGSFLGMNPFQMQAIQAATRPLAQQYEQQVLPGVSSMFSRAGRYGSEAMGTALGRATEASARAIGDVSSNIAYQGYEAERARQQQAMGAQLQAATLAPQIYGQQFLPSQQLAQVGAAREAIAAQPLQEAITRYNFQQQIPYQQLQGFLSSVYGTPMASSQYAPPAQTNQFGQALGGAAIGAGLGSLFGGAGGFTGSQIGAGLGALGGLLF